MIFFIAGCSQSDQINNSKLEGPAQSDLFGEYVYNNEKHFTSENDSIVFNEMLRIKLVLRTDSSYTENNENFQCFANLPDYSGTFSVVDSTLICYRKILGVHHVDSSKEVLPALFTENKIATMTYRIRNKTLISMSDSSIALVKKN